MHSKDVGHSFFVRQLRVQQDFVPGLDVSLHFTATKIGKYEIVCNQLCGLGHYNMKAYLCVYSQVGLCTIRLHTRHNITRPRPASSENTSSAWITRSSENNITRWRWWRP